ncbi:cysteine proteinase [Coemansia reversa NRRL 1564]|uniref:Cysteine proteinase n=1 Tax=Coemansia reversa (strain ATCC 12441 / NRRL 1564) TaxID=763665 RepID=A0A2G5BET2_COERN|nr:cysteine proteinase [Coemansia reversa NRRL 1564]|eukprot:PIA17514.1 cysteine proteinase [Coemansia reversa NRRL 1564]
MATPQETFEDLEARHRKEKKDLIATITSLKKSIPKGDKRKKKEVAAEIAELERTHSERHRAELSVIGGCSKAFTSSTPDTADNQDHDQSGMPDAKSEGGSATASVLGLYTNPSQPVKPVAKKNKARQRLQRRAEQLKRQQEEAEAEAEGMVDTAAVETEAISKLAASDGLSIQEIRPDGHCLYAAFGDQVNTYHGYTVSYSQMRKRAAEYMRANYGDFISFMTREDGDLFSESDFEKYCSDIETTATWGGQQEITALSHSFQLPVHIYQSNMPVLRIGEDAYSANNPIRLSYHRHAYGLGEHYNSLRKDPAAVKQYTHAGLDASETPVKHCSSLQQK